jgi:hypothetical protein
MVNEMESVSSRVGDGGSSFLGYAAQLFGLLAGAAALVYITGAIVLGGRLFFAQLPAQSVVGQLPREFLIAIGMAQVILPALILVSVYAGIRVWRGERSKPPARPERPLRLPEMLAGLVIAAVLVAPGILGWPLVMHAHTEWAFLNGEPERGWSTVILVACLALALTALAVLLAFSVRQQLAARAVNERRGLTKDGQLEPARWAWCGWRSIASRTAVYALVLLVPLVLVGADFRLSETKVCLTEGRWMNGVLLGGTSKGVYVGENRTALPRRIAFVPDVQIKEIFVGGDAGTADVNTLSTNPADSCARTLPPKLKPKPK